ncbi:BON domain-containing protein [Methylophilus flavus]
MIELLQLIGINIMKTDTQLKHDVAAELKWDSSVNENEIGVEVKDGIVTLSGHVGKYSEKWAAERAAQKVQGVKALAIDLDVKLLGANNRNDTDIARTAKNVLDWTTDWPKDQVKVMVEDGWITLTGQLDYEYQRQRAFSNVHYLMGVTGVSNQITLKPFLSKSSVQSVIEAALKRRALTDSQEVVVTVDGDKVNLSGVVHSWSERDMVSDSVRNTPGVSEVSDNITVAY